MQEAPQPELRTICSISWSNGRIFNLFDRLQKRKIFIQKLKKTLDKRGFLLFIIMVTWLVAVAIKTKGKDRLSSLFFLYLELEVKSFFYFGRIPFRVTEGIFYRLKSSDKPLFNLDFPNLSSRFKAGFREWKEVRVRKNLQKINLLWGFLVGL